MTSLCALIASPTATFAEKAFANFKQLQVHRANATRAGGDHGAYTLAVFIMTNECCNCGTILASMAAKQHSRDDAAIGFCRPRQTRRKRCGPYFPIKCIICEESLNDLDGYNSHIYLEFPFPRVLPTAVSNASVNDANRIDCSSGQHDHRAADDEVRAQAITIGRDVERALTSTPTRSRSGKTTKARAHRRHTTTTNCKECWTVRQDTTTARWRTSWI